MEGESTCIVELSYFYDVGIGAKPNMRKTFKYSKLAAQKGDEVGIYNLAECYLFGKGTIKNTKKAIALLMRATRTGYADAFYRLSEIYEEGIGTRKDQDTANLWLLEALKHKSFKAYIKYAEMCLTGTKGKRKPDIEVAMRVIAKFHMEVDCSYVDELNRYKELKEKYPNLIDWDDIEANPISYFYERQKTEMC
jgi:TPR repeat protein